MPRQPRNVDRVARAAQRFWARARVEDNGCWPWVGGLRPNGYGEARQVVGKPTQYAHRAAYQMVKGEIPEGLAIDHLCRNRACVNPDHLEAVTNRENLMRSPLTLAGCKLHRDRKEGH